MNRTYKIRNVNGRQFGLLTLPGSDFFQFEIINKIGSNIERAAQVKFGRNFFGIAHLIEHLGFRSPKDWTSEQINKLLTDEGVHNASTNHDRINYFFRTTSDRAPLAVQLVCNCALNDLTTISNEEFETEKRVVYNEVKRYADDDQTMFNISAVPAILGNKFNEDNILGTTETVDAITLQDAIEIKDFFLSHGEHVYNLTYDPMHYSENEVIDLVEKQLVRFPTIKKPEHDGLLAIHNDMLTRPTPGEFFIDNASEQVMTFIIADVISNNSKLHAANAGSEYLARYSATSLNEIIREKNGLTYGLHFSVDTVAYKPYLEFACDVSKGTETLLMELFVNAIEQSLPAYTPEEHNRFFKIKTLKRKLAFVDQKQYTTIHNTGTWYPGLVEKYKGILAEDLDAALLDIDKMSSPHSEVVNYIRKVSDAVVNKEYSKVTNLKE